MDSTGNVPGRQRKAKDEQTNKLFPPVSGIALGCGKKEGGRGGGRRGSSRYAPSSISSGSTWSERGSSRLSSISDGCSFSASFRLSSSISFLEDSSSPCVPVCSSAPIYSRRGRREAGTKLNIPESIAEEEEQKEAGEGEGRARGRADGSGKTKKKKRKSKKRRNTVPIPRTRNGRHYLEWNIPKGLIESLCLKESLPTIVMPPPPKELSPMHSVEKYHWVKKLTDPKAKALPFPSYGPEKPPLKTEEHPPTKQAFLESFKKCFEKVPKVVIYGNKVSPSGGHKTSKPPPDHASKTFPCPFSADHEHKSLLLNHNDYFTARQQGNTHGFTNSMFTKCPREGMWFVIHPDFRMEPGRMRGVGPG